MIGATESDASYDEGRNGMSKWTNNEETDDAGSTLVGAAWARTAIAAATENLLAAILCAAAAVWTRVAGEAVWLTVLLVVLAVAGLVTAGLILQVEARQ